MSARPYRSGYSLSPAGARSTRNTFNPGRTLRASMKPIAPGMPKSAHIAYRSNKQFRREAASARKIFATQYCLNCAFVIW